MSDMLQQVQLANVAMLDRWKISFKNNTEEAAVPTTEKNVKKDVIFNNYFGIGVDAQIVLNFHTMREQSPDKFFSRIVNQLWYGMLGWKEIWTPHCTNLKQFIKLKADGEVIDLPENTEGLIFSNIPSFGGGMKLWNCNDCRNSPRSGSPFSTFLKGSSISSMDMSSLMHQEDVSYFIGNGGGDTGSRNNLLRNRKVKSSPNLAEMRGENCVRSRTDQGWCLFFWF